jgi:hypothetical protein
VYQQVRCALYCFILHLFKCHFFCHHIWTIDIKISELTWVWEEPVHIFTVVTVLPCFWCEGTLTSLKMNIALDC